MKKRILSLLTIAFLISLIVVPLIIARLVYEAHQKELPIIGKNTGGEAVSFTTTYPTHPQNIDTSTWIDEHSYITDIDTTK